MPNDKDKEKQKKTKQRSREYLEAALEQARKLLPGWQYAVIHRAAMPSSGGRAAHNRRLSAMEKVWANGLDCEALETPELHETQGKLRATVLTYVRKGMDTGNVQARLAQVTSELTKRAGDASSFAPVLDQVAKFAETGEAPELPATRWEVVKADALGVACVLADMDTGNPPILSNPNSLDLAPGDIVEANAHGEIQNHSTCVMPNTLDEVDGIDSYRGELEIATKSVDFVGPQDAKLVFVSACPSALELARGEALTGQDGLLFESRYLEPLGLTKSEVAVGFSIPVRSDANEKDISLWSSHLTKALERFPGAKFVALGRVAKQALGPLMLDFSMPHPAAVRRHGDRGEVDRKVKAIAKALDMGAPNIKTQVSSKVEPSHGDSGANLADSISETSKDEGLRVAVTKSLEEKQIVYGVVLDPYQVDLHGDWLPPAEIESTAHDFLAKSRIVGLNHEGKADASIVESWVEIYPSNKDRDLALENLPHKVFRRKFGSDTIHSGAWVAGVKLSDKLWASYKAGDLDAFSIGGFSLKTKIADVVMPPVEFVDLTP